MLELLSPEAALKRGYAIIRSHGSVTSSVKKLKPGQELELSLKDGQATANIKAVKLYTRSWNDYQKADLPTTK